MSNKGILVHGGGSPLKSIFIKLDDKYAYFHSNKRLDMTKKKKICIRNIMNAKKKLLQDFNKYWEVKNNTYWEQKKKVVPQILGIQKKSCCKVFRHVGQ